MSENISRNARHFLILAVGPIVRDGGMLPTRVVLRRNGAGDSGFVTHMQAVKGRDDNLHAGFYWGHYFNDVDSGKAAALKRAVADFCSRVTEHTAGKTKDELSLMSGAV